jgi:WD40 repeat protein
MAALLLTLAATDSTRLSAEEPKPRHILWTWKASAHSVAFSPDGKTLASVGDYDPVALWDTTSGECTRTLKGTGTGCLCVAFSPDGKTLATGEGGDVVRLWDAGTGKRTAELSGNEGPIFHLAFNPDGKSLAVVGEDGKVRFFDVASWKRLSSLKGDPDCSSVAFSPDGKVLASVGDGAVRLWDAATGECVRELEGRPGRSRQVAFSPDGNTLAAAGRTIWLWDVPVGKDPKVGEQP